MKYAIISDIHGNHDALSAVLADVDAAGVDRVVCLGDVVGYGAQPRECIATLRERKIVTVAGNHDYAAIGKTPINYFNPFAKEATLWTRRVCTDEDKEWLRGLSLVEYLEDFTIVHGSLYAPENFEYVLTRFDAYLSFQLLETPVCFIGHSHVPMNYVCTDAISDNEDLEIRLRADGKLIVNVGSVGQPRDLNPQACYALYDRDEQLIRIRRVDYDVECAATKIREAGLPVALGERLRTGH